jgi:flagellar M-ring protein FliF
VRVTRNASGTVKRLNAAVVVNHRAGTDAKGKATQVPLSNDELEKLTTLVREGLGLKTDRGDSVKVINAPFKVETNTAKETPWWRQPEVIDLGRSAVLPGALVLVALVVFFGLIRPSVKLVTAPPLPAPEPPPFIAVVDETPALPVLQAPDALGSNEQLEGVRQMARQNPAAVASILRGWVSKGEGAANP